MDKKFFFETEFNKDYPVKIAKRVYSTYSWETYLLEDGREVCIDVNPFGYACAESIKGKKNKYVADVEDCFTIGIKDEYGEAKQLFCFVTEPLSRRLPERIQIENAIVLFIKAWTEYLKQTKQETMPIMDKIEEQYVADRAGGRKFVLDFVKRTSSDDKVKEVVEFIDAMYSDVKKNYKFTQIYLYADNIGKTKNGDYKISNLSIINNGFEKDYSIQYTKRSITVIYTPKASLSLFETDTIQLLCPVWVKMEDGRQVPVKAQIDTGAETSGFTEEFFIRAGLPDLGESKVSGVTGTGVSIVSECDVEFPNGKKVHVNGRTIKDTKDGVSMVIGMNVLRYCKFSVEPYQNGYKYKLIFLF